MPSVCRVTDTNAVGGQLLTGSSSVFIDGLPVALHPSKITPHIPFKGKHKTAKTIKGSSSLMVDGKPVVLVGDPTDCGHPIIKGSTTVFAS